MFTSFDSGFFMYSMIFIEINSAYLHCITATLYYNILQLHYITTYYSYIILQLYYIIIPTAILYYYTYIILQHITAAFYTMSMSIAGFMFWPEGGQLLMIQT